MDEKDTRFKDPEIISEVTQDVLEKDGFEIHPFKIGWYNEMVEEPFKFPYDEDTFAILVISTPSMYEKAFKPFICRSNCDGVRDPIDDCVAGCFKRVIDHFDGVNVEAIHDFELLPSRRPKVLVQTAGHVAGAAYYYRRSDVQPDPWGEKQKIYGVSIHPKYGGWFAFRGVLIFKDVLHKHLPRKQPPDAVPDMKLRQDLLEKFNFNWQDWTYRDIISTQETYSEEQKLYFATAPADRKQLLQSIAGTQS